MIKISLNPGKNWGRGASIGRTVLREGSLGGFPAEAISEQGSVGSKGANHVEGGLAERAARGRNKNSRKNKEANVPGM